MADFLKLQGLIGGVGLLAPRRHQGAGEAQLGGFLQPLVPLAHRPHLAGQADLAED